MIVIEGPQVQTETIHTDTAIIQVKEMFPEFGDDFVSEFLIYLIWVISYDVIFVVNFHHKKL